MTSFMISSADIFFWYAASGFSVECEWFFSLMRANSSNGASPYWCSYRYCMPICANTPGIR